MATLDEQFAQAKTDLNNQIAAAKASLQSEKDSTLLMIQESHDAAQSQINSGSLSLSKQVEGLAQFQLDNPLQPIVINAEQKTPWGLLLAVGVTSYILFKRR